MKVVDPTACPAEYLALEYLASEPYTSFVYESSDQARALARDLLERGLGEFAPPFGTVAVDEHDGTVLGMLAFVDGAALEHVRMEVAIAFVREALISDDAVSDRIRLAASALMAVDASDLYLSRIAVAASARGRGIGKALMGVLERAARSQGKTRLVLEVSPQSTAALKLYQTAAFEVADERNVQDPQTGRSLTYRHMFKPVH
jgi:ribosomal protein S18 acetylase RimI-like enzyme